MILVAARENQGKHGHDDGPAGHHRDAPVAEDEIEMGAHQLADVERIVAREQAVPDDRHDAGSGEQLRKADQRIVAQLAAIERAPQQRPHRRNDAPKHLAIVEVGDLGKPRSFADDQPQDVLAVGAVDLAHEQSERALRHGPHRQVERQRRLQRAHHGADLGADELLEQPLLVAEVKIDRAFGDAGALRHVVEPGGGEALRGEFLQRGGEDGAAALGALAGRRARD